MIKSKSTDTQTNKQKLSKGLKQDFLKTKIIT